MRSSEWIVAGFFVAFAIAGLLAPIDAKRRLRIGAIGLAGVLVAGSLGALSPHPVPPLLRDLLPGLLLLMAYWQAGQFLTGPDASLQAWLRGFDERWFPGMLRLSSELPERPALASYLETAYMACYVVLPAGILVLHLAGDGGSADRFWRVVLPATLPCYVATARFQSLPPRLVEGKETRLRKASGLRSLNLWVLRHLGIRGNTLPSGHVASSLAAALVLLAVAPLAGIVFLWTAASISVATVVLRYHYGLDVILGAGLALVSFSVFG
jgi:membrane-associated phospholipid phosphatase